MTEAEWLACNDTDAMLKFLLGKRKSRTRGGTKARKLRLFVAACCYRVWQWMPDERTRIGVEMAEKQADGLIGEDELKDALKGTAVAWTTVWGMGWHIFQSARAAHFALAAKLDILVMGAHEVVKAHWNHTKDTLPCSEDSAPAQKTMAQERSYQVGLLRDIFGNPFCPLTISPTILAWNDSVVVRLAQAAYEERQLPEGTLDNTRLLILADALEESGCTDAEILGHLRGPGPHVRGWWPVDLCLGKS